MKKAVRFPLLGSILCSFYIQTTQLRTGSRKKILILYLAHPFYNTLKFIFLYHNHLWKLISLFKEWRHWGSKSFNYFLTVTKPICYRNYMWIIWQPSKLCYINILQPLRMHRSFHRLSLFLWLQFLHLKVSTHALHELV